MSNLESQPLNPKSQVLAALMAPTFLSCHLLIKNTFVSSLNFPMYSCLRQSKLMFPSPAGIALSDFSLGTQSLKRKEGEGGGGAGARPYGWVELLGSVLLSTFVNIANVPSGYKLDFI